MNRTFLLKRLLFSVTWVIFSNNNVVDVHSEEDLVNPSKIRFFEKRDKHFFDITLKIDIRYENVLIWIYLINVIALYHQIYLYKHWNKQNRFHFELLMTYLVLYFARITMSRSNHKQEDFLISCFHENSFTKHDYILKIISRKVTITTLKTNDNKSFVFHDSLISILIFSYNDATWKDLKGNLIYKEILSNFLEIWCNYFET